MQLVARLMDHVLAQRGERATIVAATSGDTGGAAVEAFRGRKRVDVVVLFPRRARLRRAAADDDHRGRRERPCARDRRHLRRLPGDREGAVQRPGLPRAGEALGRQLDQLGADRGAGGLLFHRRGGARRARQGRHASSCRPEISAIFSRVTPPSAWGLPAERLVIATNVNDILARTLATGRYEPRGVVATQSPAMDIQVSSNFERLLFEAYGREAAAVRALMQALAETKALSPSASRARRDPRRFRGRPGRRGRDARHDPRRACARAAICSIRTARSVSRWRASAGIKAARRSSCSAPRIRRNFPTRSRPPPASGRNCRRASPIS